jgi:hypothetical protein
LLNEGRDVWKKKKVGNIFSAGLKVVRITKQYGLYACISELAYSRINKGLLNITKDSTNQSFHPSELRSRCV